MRTTQGRLGTGYSTSSRSYLSTRSAVHTGYRKTKCRSTMQQIYRAYRIPDTSAMTGITSREQRLCTEPAEFPLDDRGASVDTPPLVGAAWVVAVHRRRKRAWVSDRIRAGVEDGGHRHLLSKFPPALCAFCTASFKSWPALSGTRDRRPMRGGSSAGSVKFP